MNDNERETFAVGNASGSDKSQLDSGNKSNSKEESNQLNSNQKSNQSYSNEESNGRDSYENCRIVQFILPIDKGYTSASKTLFYGIVQNYSHTKMDAVYSSQARTPQILGKVFSLLASESFLRVIERGDVKAVTEFLKSSWTFYARHLEDSCLNPIGSNFLLNINNNHTFAESSLNLSAKNRTAKAFSLITSALFFKAFEQEETNSVKRFLNGSRSERSMCLETLCIKPIGKNFLVTIEAFDMDCLLGSCISFFDWLECIYISSKASNYKIAFEISGVLFRFEKIVDGVTKNGWTALHLTMFQFQNQFERRERNILLLLLKFKYFDVNALTDELETVLHFACRCSVSNEEYTEFMSELLKHILNVNQKNSFGQTPLMIACKTGNAAAVRQLLEWNDDNGEKLDISARREGENAISLAKQSNNVEIVAMIEAAIFLKAVKNGDIDTVKFYLNALPNEHDRGILENVSDTNAYAKESMATSFKAKGMELSPSKETDLSFPFAEKSNNPEIVLMVEQSAFLMAVENSDTETVKINPSTKESNFEVLYRRAETDIHFAPHTDHYEHNSEKMGKLPGDDALNQEAPVKSFEAEIEAQFASKDFITHSIWFEAVNIASHKRHDIVLNMLFNSDSFIHGFNENGQTVLHQAVKEYLVTTYDDLKLDYMENILESRKKLDRIEILLKSRKFSANDLNFQNETILEIVCKAEPLELCTTTENLVESYNSDSSDDEEKTFNQISNLLEIFLRYGIDLNGRNKNGETLLMLACENGRTDIVRSLIELTSHGFVVDVDAVDNSGETALIKAKRNKDPESAAAFLRLKLKPAVEDENEAAVKSIFDGFCITSDNSVKDDEEKSIRFEIWQEAMSIAIEYNKKHAEKILNLLLDCDVVLSQEGHKGFHILHRLMEFGDLGVDKKITGLIEVLLESGKINVNAKSYEGHTVLHYAKKGKLASLLIRYGADVNEKDNYGKTPLMLASIFMFTLGYKASVMRTILNEARILDLDARDRNGRTALMLAATRDKPDVVEMLLNAGASVNSSDLIGFTALHHALSGDIAVYEEFPRNFEDLKERKEIMANLFDAEVSHDQCYWYGRSKEWNDRRIKTVELLLRRSDIDVNAISFENWSPLDIAEGWIRKCPSSIKNALKEKGAALSVFQPTELQTTSDFHLNVTCMVTLLGLIDKLVIEKENYFAFIKEKLLTLIETFHEQIVSGKDYQGRTALHLVAISFSIMRGVVSSTNNLFYSMEEDLARTCVKQLISLGCCVNAIDIYGRTPLHYANYRLQKVLKSKGADESIKDENGIIPKDETSRNDDDAQWPPIATYRLVQALCKRPQETHFLRLKNNKNIEISVQHSESQYRAIHVMDKTIQPKEVPKLLWKEGKYAFRHPLVNKIVKKVRDLMDTIADEIKRLDSRFEIRPILVGSSNEGTKFGEPDEFDFCFVLTKISELCEVCLPPELPIGFVRLKRNLAKQKEASESDIDSIFRQDGILNTEKLIWQFGTILRSAVICIEKQQNFEWNLKLQKPKLNEELCLYNTEYINTYYEIKKALNIKIIKPLIFTSGKTISIDIVPCIHIDGWWPDEAISNVSYATKKFGCNLVFDSPQELYQWVPYSESCARISFCKAESDTVRQSCDTAREAYMIGKRIISNSDFDTQYILKNSLLYCIEAITPTSEKAFKLGLSLEELESKFQQMDRYLWLKCLMKCHLEFISQDFCPCYFLPTFSSPVKVSSIKFLKGSYLASMMDDSGHEFADLCKMAYEFYRCTLKDSSESFCQLPAPDPLWERFDRNQLIASLCEVAYK